MDTQQSHHILISQGAETRAEPLLNLLRRAHLRLTTEALVDDHLPDDRPDKVIPDLILLFADQGQPGCEALLRQLQLSRRDIPCLIICRSPSRWLPMLGLGAAGLISESQLESAAGRVQFVYQVRRELEQLQERRAARRAMNSIRELHQRMQMFIDTTRDAVATLQGGLHQSVNRAWLEFFGFRNLAEAYTVPFLDLVAPEDVDRVRTFLADPFQGNSARCEFTAVRRDGTDILASMDSGAIRVNGAQSLQLIVQPAMGNTQKENDVRQAMGIDLQSGLLNEHTLFKLINQAISAAVYQKTNTALVLLSCSQLPDVSVALGKTDTHILLREIAQTLTHKSPKGAHLGRLDSGDFIILLPPDSNASDINPVDDLDALERALHTVAPDHLTLTFQAGVAIITEEVPDAETVLVRARHHQTVRQHHSRNTHHATTGADQQQLDLLRKALAEESLVFVYQPTVSLRADTLEHYEVRIRVPLADRLMYPGEFLEKANQHGFGERVDRYVISHALQMIANQGNDKLRLMVNLTANSLTSRTLLVWITQELQRQRQTPRQLILQISELDVISAPTDARRFCQQLRDLGFEFSVSQFGCSLDPLRLSGQLQPNFVKLDKSLLQHIDLDTNQRERLQSVVSQLHGQGIKVIAPLIEDIELLPLLWHCQVNHVQGNGLQQPGDELSSGLFQTTTISLPPRDLHSEIL